MGMLGGDLFPFYSPFPVQCPASFSPLLVRCEAEKRDFIAGDFRFLVFDFPLNWCLV